MEPVIVRGFVPDDVPEPAYVVVRPDADHPWAVGDEVLVYKRGETEPVLGRVTEVDEGDD